ncbi:YbaB/EbfC family nucleoid-associated protein [Thermomonospora echinospora]|uniref:YbaB/EbfC family nucleoid-associated protein n=1 Tax=Thermomonospora echinospora TaxID=1992 RepID=UPI0011B0C4D3|nr:YbaB/EbfC family nucleoid-associated protein [Thermomonospora echinospora]
MAERARVKSLEIHPRVMGLPVDELAECSRTAINAALDDLRSKLPFDAAPGMDAGAVTRYLDEVQTQGLQTMEALTSSLSEAMSLLRESVTFQGGPAPHGLHGLQGLLAESQRMLASVAVPPHELPELEGTGEAAQGLVRAVAEPGGRIRSLVVEKRAMRSPSQELAGHLVTAVNAALDDLQSRSEREAGSAGIDQEEISRLRESSMQQSADFMRSLADMINSIQPR